MTSSQNEAAESTMIDIAHIHPMLVHFPIVFFLTAIVIDGWLVLRGVGLGERRCITQTAFGLLLVGWLFAVAAASFGDMALDKAASAGFPKGPMDEHEDLAGATITLFGLLVVIQGFALWRNFRLAGKAGWLFVVLGLVGVGLLISTAWHGGHLVYDLGVNVGPVKPTP